MPAPLNKIPGVMIDESLLKTKMQQPFYYMGINDALSQQGEVKIKINPDKAYTEELIERIGKKLEDIKNKKYEWNYADCEDLFEIISNAFIAHESEIIERGE